MRTNLCRMIWTGVALFAATASAKEPTAREIRYLNYDKAVELREKNVRVVLGPQAGGRVLEFSIGGKQALYLDEKEAEWQPGAKSPLSAGRFDYGPELVVKPHPAIWSGDWESDITGPHRVKLTSPRDESAGVQLFREFELVTYEISSGEDRIRLDCRQTILNIGPEEIEVCHWGRSFSPGGGIALVPLGGRPSRFPSKYAMYEEAAIINVRNTDPQIRERDGFLEILGPPRKPKLGFDSFAGWVGYLMPNRTLFVKRYDTFPNRPYNEAAGLTLSLWYPEGPRIEIEPIGPRERLNTGQRATFVESWHLLDYDLKSRTIFDEPVDLERVRRLVDLETRSTDPTDKL
jgi:hypothetical protein